MLRYSRRLLWLTGCLLLVAPWRAHAELNIQTTENGLVTVPAYYVAGALTPLSFLDGVELRFYPLTFGPGCSVNASAVPPVGEVEANLGVWFSHQDAVLLHNCWALDKAIATVLNVLLDSGRRPLVIGVALDEHASNLGTGLMINYGVAAAFEGSYYTNLSMPQAIVFAEQDAHLLAAAGTVAFYVPRHNPITVEGQSSAYFAMCLTMFFLMVITAVCAIAVPLRHSEGAYQQRSALSSPVLQAALMAIFCALRGYTYLSLDMHGLANSERTVDMPLIAPSSVWIALLWGAYFACITCLLSAVSIWTSMLRRLPVVLHSILLRRTLRGLSILAYSTLFMLFFVMFTSVLYFLPAGVLANADTVYIVFQIGMLFFAVSLSAFPLVNFVFIAIFIMTIRRNSGFMKRAHILRVGFDFGGMSISFITTTIMFLTYFFLKLPLAIPPFTARTSLFLVLDASSLLCFLVIITTSIMGVQRMVSDSLGSTLSEKDYYFARWHLLGKEVMDGLASESERRSLCREEGLERDRHIAMAGVSQIRKKEGRQRERERNVVDAIASLEWSDAMRLLPLHGDDLVSHQQQLLQQGDADSRDIDSRRVSWTIKLEQILQFRAQRIGMESLEDKVWTLLSSLMATNRDMPLDSPQNAILARMLSHTSKRRAALTESLLRQAASPSRTLNTSGLGLQLLSEQALLSAHPRATECVAVDLSQNVLQSVPDVILSRFRHITLLDLSGNLLHELPREMTHLSQLTHLYLNCNRLTELPDGFRALRHLTTLWLGGNSLRDMPLEVQMLPALRELILCDNMIGKIPDGAFAEALPYCASLEVLDVSGNDLAVIPNTISACSRLTELRADRNRLRVLPPAVFALPQLRILSLYANYLSRLAESDVARLAASVNEVGEPRLRVLDLSANELSELPEGLWLLSGLRALRLDWNRLKSVSSHVGQVRQLNEARLCHNELRYLPCEMEMLRNLSRLDMRGNRLRSSPMLSWWVLGGQDAITWKSLMLLSACCLGLLALIGTLGGTYEPASTGVNAAQSALIISVPFFALAVNWLPAYVVLNGRLRLFQRGSTSAVRSERAFEWNWFNFAAVVMLAVEATQLCALAFVADVPWGGPLATRLNLLAYLIFDVSSQGAAIILMVAAMLAIVLFRVLIDLRLYLHRLVSITFVLHVLVNLLFIPILFVLARPLSCVISGSWAADERSDITGASLPCYSLGHLMLMITGLVGMAVFVPTAVLLSPIWQQRVDKLQLRYRPRVVVGLLLIKFTQAFAVRTFGVTMTARSAINCAFILLQLAVWLRGRPSHLPQVNLWRAVGMLVAIECTAFATWTSVIGSDVPIEQVSALPAYIMFGLTSATILGALFVSINGMQAPIWLAPFTQRSGGARAVRSTADNDSLVHPLLGTEARLPTRPRVEVRSPAPEDDEDPYALFGADDA